MSDLPSDYRAQLDMRAVISRIDRDRAEDKKLQAEREKIIVEQQKLAAEQSKLAAEQGKLVSEGKRYDRDRWILPLTAVLSLLGILIAGIFARLPEILHVLGYAP